MSTTVNYSDEAEISLTSLAVESRKPGFVHFFARQATPVALLITRSGKVVFEDHVQSRVGQNKVNLDLGNFSEGNYELSLLTSTRICKKRFQLV
ncbi:MAG: hypothetical protein H6581_05945 [Bacteroidia bacterium]|nr:hypothetical protein [Bacteroidia bacterium]